jgi:hypothetical protein
MVEKWESARGPEHRSEVWREYASRNCVSVARNAERPMPHARRRQYGPAHSRGFGKIAALALEVRPVFLRKQSGTKTRA